MKKNIQVTECVDISEIMDELGVIYTSLRLWLLKFEIIKTNNLKWNYSIMSIVTGGNFTFKKLRLIKLIRGNGCFE